MRSLDRDVTAIGLLADSVRRRLYRYVCSQPLPVSRDQAAEALGVARHQAKFHLDRLEDEGLLTSEYLRPRGRSGPGAGRPTKRYRRGDREFAVSVPYREYALVAQVLADAVVHSAATGDPVVEAVARAAAARGRAIADEAGAARRGPPPDPSGMVVDVLHEQGYEPHPVGSAVVLTNCPFHALVRSHGPLACQLNHALIGELVRCLAPAHLEVLLEPAAGRCCITLSTRRQPQAESPGPGLAAESA